MRFRISLIIIIAITLFYNSSCKNKVNKKLVYDQAGILSQYQFNYLDSIVKNYKLKTTSDIFIYAVNKTSDSVDRDTYAFQLINKLGVGVPGLNNGVLIFISLQDRRIDIQLAHGFEWLISKNESDKIIRKMIDFFSNADFFHGISYAVDRIIFLTRSTPWSICKKGNYSNCVLKVRVKSILNQSRSTLKILTTDGNQLSLDYTQYMIRLIDTIKKNADHKIQIFCRPTGNNSKEALLLGINS